MREMIEAEPALAKEQPYKAIAENDQEFLGHLLEHAAELAKGVTEAYAGITTEAFEEAVEKFFASASHPTIGVPYTSVGYAPMRELIELLEATISRSTSARGAGATSFVRSARRCSASPASA